MNYRHSGWLWAKLCCSIFGPVLFSIYMLPLGSIFRKHNVSFHCFADDMQIYLPLKINEKTSVQVLLDCLKDIRSWMEANFLSMNKNKTEIIVFGQQNRLDCYDSAIGNLESHCHPFARNLGVILDRDFGFNKQISSIVKSTPSHLCYITPGLL